MRPRIVICASGEGAHFATLLAASRSQQLHAEVAGLITNRPGSGALAKATALGVASMVLPLRDFSARSEWDAAFLRQLKAWRADWVVLAGFLALIGPEVLFHFKNRVVNIHPALLPRYGGPGMYGLKVHAAVLAAGEMQTGITVHLVDEQYDHGRIIAQHPVPVENGDTAESLAARVKTQELALYPKIINELVTGTHTLG